MTGKSKEEVEELKRQWTADPVWDIEDTPGFEEHRGELLRYKNQIAIGWKEKESNRIKQKAMDLRIPDNFALTHYIDWLEKRLEYQSERLDYLVDVISKMKG